MKHVILSSSAFAASLHFASAAVFQLDLQMAGSPTSQESQAGWTAWDVGKANANPINTTVTGVGVTITANGTGAYVTARGGDPELRGGEITGTSWDDVVEDFAVARGGDGTATLSLTNLNSALTYALTVYHNESYNNNANPGFSGGSQTPGMTNGTLVGTANSGLIGFNIAGAHVDGDFDQSVISFTPDGSGNASILYTSSSNYVVFNGIELNVVPEPSSTALLGLAGLSLFLRRRR